MARISRSRLVTPAIALALGTVIACAVAVRQGWGVAVGCEAVGLVWAGCLYVTGGSDSDTGSVIGAQGDERQQLVGLRAARLSLLIVVIALAVSCLIAAVAGTSIWPFEVLLVIIAITYFIGLRAFGVDASELEDGARYSWLGFRQKRTSH